MKLSICVLYPEGQTLHEWKRWVPTGPDVQIVALQTKINPELKQKKIEVIGQSDNLVGIQVEFTNFEENFDFSECRNILDQHATGEWILHIDSDERLLNPYEELRDHITALGQTEAQASWVSIVGVSFEALDELQRAKRYNIPSLRLYKNNQGFKWVGICHETLDVNGTAVISESELILGHSGYAIGEQEMLGKCERNAKLMVREYSSRKTERNWSYLVETFSLIKKLKEV